MVKALVTEIAQRRNYLAGGIQTVYFGGGTPSLLTKEQLAELMNVIRNEYLLLDDLEVTLEANPEDLTADTLSSIKEVGVNRLSIGMQTFSDQQLEWMNRNHTSHISHEAFELARKKGFSNISLDLIYALPGLSSNQWKDDLKEATRLDPEHISLYGLTIEKKTVFGNWANSGKLKEIPEEEAAAQYLDSIAFLQESGYQQYEVSNFSKPSYESKHNTAYWLGKQYLGIGPGAHSFNGSSRQFNIRNNAKYLKAIHEKVEFYESEELSETQKINETILTRLRTVNGIDLDEFTNLFDIDLKKEKRHVISQMKSAKFLNSENNRLSLTSAGFLVADEIALQLFFHE